MTIWISVSISGLEIHDWRLMRLMGHSSAWRGNKKIYIWIVVGRGPFDMERHRKLQKESHFDFYRNFTHILRKTNMEASKREKSRWKKKAAKKKRPNKRSTWYQPTLCGAGLSTKIWKSEIQGTQLHFVENTLKDSRNLKKGSRRPSKECNIPI